MTSVTFQSRILTRVVSGHRWTAWRSVASAGSNGYFTQSYSSSSVKPNSYSLQSARAQSTASHLNASPSYQVYGETAALSVKAISPEFRVVGQRTLVMNNSTGSNKGRLLLEWVQRNPATARYAWDQPLRFALSPEEVGLVLTRLQAGHALELARQTGGNWSPEMPPDMSSNSENLQKVLMAHPQTDGGVLLRCDYELEGVGGQPPPSHNEGQGPMEVTLTVGEHRVLQSIMEYSIPRLVGWAPLMDQAYQHSFQQSAAASSGPPTDYGNHVPF